MAIRERMFQLPELNLYKAIELGEAAEETTKPHGYNSM